MDTVLHFLHYLLSFALVVSIIVFIHELGHFLAARACGVKVDIFSIGFGRELAGFTDKRGTRWKFSLWPLGGYVKMHGDAGASSAPDAKTLAAMPKAERRYSFHYKPLWAKAIIVAAGPLANFLLAILVFTYFIFTVGVASTEPVVGAVLPNTPAASAGLKAGDRILSVDGKEMKRFNDIPNAIATNLETPVKLEVKRGERVFTLTITPRETEEKDALGNASKRPLIGFRSQEMKYTDVSLPNALWLATTKTYDLCVMSLTVLGQMVRGERSTESLQGPVGIAKLSGDVTQQGKTFTDTLHLLLWFVALLSVNLGLVNLFPIPMLDGGHLLFYTIEAFRGRPLAERVQEYSFRFGIFLIGCLMVLTLYNDMKRILS